MSKTKTRVYCVSDGNTDRHVRASSRSAARNHVARDVYRTRVATQDDLILHLQNGGKIEEAGAEDEDEQS